MAEHSNKRSYPKHLALLAASFLPLGATVLVSDMASAQLLQLLQQPQVQHHAQVIRRTAARLNPPERTKAIPDTRQQRRPALRSTRHRLWAKRLRLAIRIGGTRSLHAPRTERGSYARPLLQGTCPSDLRFHGTPHRGEISHKHLHQDRGSQVS